MIHKKSGVSRGYGALGGPRLRVETPDHTFIRKAVKAVAPDDDVIQNLDIQKPGGPNEIPRQHPVLSGG